MPFMIVNQTYDLNPWFAWTFFLLSRVIRHPLIFSLLLSDFEEGWFEAPRASSLLNIGRLIDTLQCPVLEPFQIISSLFNIGKIYDWHFAAQ